MVFCCVLYGHFLPLIWHFDEETGLNISVNSEVYLRAVQKILSNIPNEQIEMLWWQQDGASVHTAKIVMQYLRERFGDRIISRTAKYIWSAHSPDLNPLDYSVWGIFENHVNHVNPQDKIGLINTVNEAANELFMDQDLVRKIILNIKKRAKLCVEQKGGHFEHLLKLKNYENEE